MSKIKYIIILIQTRGWYLEHDMKSFLNDSYWNFLNFETTQFPKQISKLQNITTQVYIIFLMTLEFQPLYI